MTLIGWVLVASTAPTPALAAAMPSGFEVNDLAFNTKDINPGDGDCLTATGTCSMRAVLEEINQLAFTGATGPVTVTMASTLNNGDNIIVANAHPSTLMYTANLTDQGDAGAYYWVKAPDVTIDFGGRVGIMPNDDAAYGTVFYADAPRLTLQNFTNLVGAETSIAVSSRAQGLLVRNGTFDNPYVSERALSLQNGASDITMRDVRVGDLYGDGIVELKSGATVTGLTLERVVMDNGVQNGWDHPSALYGRGSNRLVGLTVTGSTFSNFHNSASVFRFVGVAIDGARIEGNRFVANRSGGNAVIRVTTAPTGNPSVIRGNYFDNSAADATERAIEVSVGMSANTTNLLTVTDNYFVGFASHSSIHYHDAGVLTTERNRFGTPSYGSSTDTSETGDNTFLYNSGTANNTIYTWRPAPATYVPGQCAVDVTVIAPTTHVPALPVTIDAYVSMADDAEIYLGRAESISVSPTVIRFPYPVGAGKLRIQTKDAKGRSSQYSRVAPVAATDTCAPSVAVEKASWQSDPTNRRDIQFIATFSEAVSTPSAAMFSLEGSTAPGARVTDVAKLDPTSYLVTVRVDGAGLAELSLPDKSVKDLAGNWNTASTSDDNIVVFESPLALGEVEGTVTTSACATYEITETELGLAGYPAPSAPIAIELSAQPDSTITLTPNPAIIETGQHSVLVTACAAEGALIPDGTALVTHTVTSQDPAFSGLLLGQAAIPMADITPHWTMTLSASPLSGQAVRAGDLIAYKVTITHRRGGPADVAPTIDLSGALDDATWQPGSLQVTGGDASAAIDPDAAPDGEDQLALTQFTLEPGTSTGIAFVLRVSDPARSTGTKQIQVKVAAGDSAIPPDACDQTDPGDSRCRETSHPVAGVAVAKTGPARLAGGTITDPGSPAPAASPAPVTPGLITWAYTVTNTGAVPLTELSVTDDQGVDVTCPATTLSPGAVMVCRGTGGVG